MLRLRRVGVRSFRACGSEICSGLPGDSDDSREYGRANWCKSACEAELVGIGAVVGGSLLYAGAVENMAAAVFVAARVTGCNTISALVDVCFTTDTAGGLVFSSLGETVFASHKMLSYLRGSAKKNNECLGEHFIYSGARLRGVQLCTSIRMRVSASQPCAITARCKCCQSRNTVGVSPRALIINSSPRVGGKRYVNNLSRGSCAVQRAGRRDARREGTIAVALGYLLVELILLRCGEQHECDARILLRCGGVPQPKILLDLGCARRDRIAVHALCCGCAAAQRDVRGRGVCLFLTSL